MNWTIDQSHTAIEFTVKHMMLSKVRGHFEKFTGEVALNKEEPEKTTVDVRIDTSSVNTREPKRDAHLRSADFFNSEVFPEMIFKSKRVEQIDNLHAKMIGDLTIRDITREVVMNVEYTGEMKSPWGSVSVGFVGATKISRKEWNLTWNQMLESGGVLVGDEIEITIELELVQQVPTPEIGLEKTVEADRV